MLRILRNRRTRGYVIQAVVLAASLLLTLSFVLTARDNLVSQGIATGFGFLDRSTGWPINFSIIEATDRSPYSRMLLAGFLNTILVGLAGLACATCVGLAVGLMRVSSNLILNVLGTVFVETFRNVPLILQVIFWYAILTHMPSPRAAIDLAGLGFLSNRGQNGSLDHIAARPAVAKNSKHEGPIKNAGPGNEPSPAMDQSRTSE